MEIDLVKMQLGYITALVAAAYTVAIVATFLTVSGEPLRNLPHSQAANDDFKILSEGVQSPPPNGDSSSLPNPSS